MSEEKNFINKIHALRERNNTHCVYTSQITARHTLVMTILGFDGENSTGRAWEKKEAASRSVASSTIAERRPSGRVASHLLICLIERAQIEFGPQDYGRGKIGEVLWYYYCSK